MIADSFALLRGRSFAVLSNNTGRDRQLSSIIEVLQEADLRPKLILEPEHGLYGHLDALGEDGLRRDKSSDIPILSLYSAIKKPPAKYLKGVQVIVVDLQNLPLRCYTYTSTLSYLMETAEELGISIMILDRPNPYGFWKSQGSYLQEGYDSFVGVAPVPFLYTLSLGEYAHYMQALRFPNLSLEIVKVSAYRKKDKEAMLRQAWVSPSPNIPSMESALIYPAMVLLEGVQYSLGRGTTRPFVYSGAPWLKQKAMLKALRALNLPGLRIGPVNFVPNASHYSGELNLGLFIVPVSLDLDPIRTGYEYMRLLRRLHSEHFEFRVSSDGRYFIDKLWGSPDYRTAIENDLTYDQFKKTWIQESLHFERQVRPYTLY